MFKTCFELWSEEEQTPKILTLCKDLDEALGGGIPTRMITEFCGAPGSGKTQMCLQLCINVQYPKEVGGCGGKAVYIDTNQGFNPERLKEIAEFSQKRFCNTFTTQHAKFDVNFLLENVSYVYCADYVKLFATIKYLKERLRDDRQIKLIVVDSFAFPLRCIHDVAVRTTTIFQIVKYLQQLAIDFNIAIVLTNEFTTSFSANKPKICPCFGDSYAHNISQRIILNKMHRLQQYVATILKSPMTAKIAIPFVIKPSGIRGILH